VRDLPEFVIGRTSKHFVLHARLSCFVRVGAATTCPLCRSPLTPGPVELFDEATRRYVMVQRRVLRGLASWSALPTSAQLEMDAAITGWRAAADQGSAMAQFLLGDVYEKGCGVAEDEEEAARWFRKAANQGYVLAQQFLGALLARGGGDAQRDKEAVLWFMKAVAQGDAQAQHFLGHMLEEGRGVNQNEPSRPRRSSWKWTQRLLVGGLQLIKDLLWHSSFSEMSMRKVAA